MNGCGEQMYSNVPASENVCDQESPGKIGPESSNCNDWPVTVCDVSVVFIHVTWVPTGTDRFAGLKPQDPDLSTISTVIAGTTDSLDTVLTTDLEI